MAAIAGVVSSNGKYLDTSAKEMGEILEQMRHRGPDNTIVRSLPDGQGTLGANEINLTPERTSCTAVAKPPYILFDGELFNKRADGQSDIELFFSRAEAGALYANRRSGATTGAWPGYQTFCGWKGSGVDGKGGLGPYHLPRFMREQSHTIMHPA